MKGYYGRPDATAEAIQDGWFRSGDLGRRDEDGWYYIVDRSKDMIIRGGYNVYPREIEEVLMTHPAVSLAAVIGVPHESHGEEIKAVVILEDGAEVTEDELVAWGKEQMAGYKYPRIVEFVDALPMTATGKILKRELDADAAAHVAANGRALVALEDLADRAGCYRRRSRSRQPPRTARHVARQLGEPRGRRPCARPAPRSSSRPPG